MRQPRSGRREVSVLDQADGIRRHAGAAHGGDLDDGPDGGSFDQQAAAEIHSSCWRVRAVEDEGTAAHL